MVDMSSEDREEEGASTSKIQPLKNAKIKRRRSDFRLANQNDTLSTPLKLFMPDEEIDDLVMCVNLGKELSPRFDMLGGEQIQQPKKKRRLSMPVKLASSNFNPLDVFSNLPLLPATPKHQKRRRMSLKLPRKTAAVGNKRGVRSADEEQARSMAEVTTLERISENETDAENTQQPCTKAEKPHCNGEDAIAQDGNLFEKLADSAHINFRKKAKTCKKLVNSDVPNEHYDANTHSAKKSTPSTELFKLHSPELKTVSGDEMQLLSTDIQPKTPVPIIVISPAGADYTTTQSPAALQTNSPIKNAESELEQSLSFSANCQSPETDIVNDVRRSECATISNQQDTRQNIHIASVALDCTPHLQSEKALMIAESNLQLCNHVPSEGESFAETDDSLKAPVAEQKNRGVDSEQDMKEDGMGGFHISFANISLSNESNEAQAAEATDIGSVMNCQGQSDTIPAENCDSEVPSQEVVAQLSSPERPCTLSLPNMNSSVLPETESRNGEATDEAEVTRRKTRSGTKIRKTLPKLQVRHTPMGLPKPMRVKKEEFSVEEIYLNKNFKTPTEKKWETIFEFPKENKDGSVVHTEKRKKRRLCDFATDPSQRKQKWKKMRQATFIKGKRKLPKSGKEDVDQILSQKLFILDNALKLAELSP